MLKYKGNSLRFPLFIIIKYFYMTQIIILAAGKGSRMAAEVPKVLVNLQDKSILEHLMSSVIESKVDPSPIIVVSPDNIDIITQTLSSYSVKYAIQKEQLGTGHAVSCARDLIAPEADKVMVLFGDHPFITSESIQRFSEANDSVMTVMPTKVEDYKEWRYNFYHWGRFVRDENGDIERIVEFKDASEEEKAILEVNPGFMCFNKEWLLKNIDKLKNDNNAEEYYLTAMVNIAFEERGKIGTVKINPREAVGINTPEELKAAESLL